MGFACCLSVFIFLLKAMHVMFMCDSQVAIGGDAVLVPCRGCCDCWYIKQCSERDDATVWKQTVKVPFLSVYLNMKLAAWVSKDEL